MTDIIIGSSYWSAVGALGGLAMALAVIGGGVATKTNRWRKAHREEDHRLDMIDIAIFGRQADGPVPAIKGLLVEHAKVAADQIKVAETLMEQKIELVKQRSDIDRLQKDMEILMVRSQQLVLGRNGDTTLADAVMKIMKHLEIEQ